MFLEISQNSQENTWGRVSFLIKLQTPPVTVSVFLKDYFPPSTITESNIHGSETASEIMKVMALYKTHCEFLWPTSKCF